MSKPIQYVYFGGHEKRFRVLKDFGDGRLELLISQGGPNGQVTRIVHTEKDAVTTDSVSHLGTLQTCGLGPKFQFHQSRAKRLSTP